MTSPSVDSRGAPYYTAASGLCIADHNQLCITDSGNPALESFSKKICNLRVEWTSISVLSGTVSRELITNKSSAQELQEKPLNELASTSGVCISTTTAFCSPDQLHKWSSNLYWQLYQCPIGALNWLQIVTQVKLMSITVTLLTHSCMYVCMRSAIKTPVYC